MIFYERYTVNTIHHIHTFEIIAIPFEQEYLCFLLCQPEPR